jgi:hypothetical protein
VTKRSMVMKNPNSSGRAAVLVASLFVVGLGTSSVQAADPDPNDVYILGVKTNGKGCPKGDPGTVETTISEDKKSFIVNFRDMELSYPPGKTKQTTNCQADVSLHVPGGWQVSLATVTTRGLAILDNKHKANQTSTYFFAGNPPQKQYHTDIVGPQDGYFYQFTDVIPIESLVWSKCGASAIFSINTSLILDTSKNPGGQAIFNSTSMDGGFEKILQYQWKKC